jgi:hypothetical protein
MKGREGLPVKSSEFWGFAMTLYLKITNTLRDLSRSVFVSEREYYSVICVL